MAIVVLSENTFYNQNLLAQRALEIIIEDRAGDLAGILSYFGFNDSADEAVATGATRTLSADKKKLSFTRLEPTPEEGNYKKNDSVVFTGSQLDNLAASAHYAVSGIKLDVKHDRSYVTDPFTEKPIAEKFYESTKINGWISPSGLTVTNSSTSINSVYANPDNPLAWVDNESINPENYKEQIALSGEKFMSWDGSFIAQDLLSQTKTIDFSYSFYNGSTKLTNSSKETLAVTSKDGLEVLAEGLVLDDNGTPSSWDKVVFVGVVDSLNLSVASTWTSDPAEPQFSGIASYKSTEKNPYIADALNAVFADQSNGGDNLGNTLVESVLPALFFGNDVFTVRGTLPVPNDINGFAGNDLITGGKGDDIIIGGIGRDTLAGGEGNDAFVFSRGESSVLSGHTDVIRGFTFTGTRGSDRIVLDGIDQIALADNPASKAASFFEARVSANAAFKADDKNVFIQAFGAKDAILFADLNGDKVADIGITLVGVLNGTTSSELNAYMASDGLATTIDG